MHRLYETKDLSVFWDSDKCYHAKKCVGGCPEAFDPKRRPWIDLSRAPAAKVWKAIEQCPSGALSCVYTHDITITFEEENCRSRALFEGRIIGECDYQVDDGVWVIYHTEVSPDFSGKKIAKRLVFKVLEAAEVRKQQVKATCSYAAKYV